MSTAVVNIEQAMLRCGVSRRTIYNWIEAGKIKFVRTASGRPMILVDSLYSRGNVDAVGRFVADKSPEQTVAVDPVE